MNNPSLKVVGQEGSMIWFIESPASRFQITANDTLLLM